MIRTLVLVGAAALLSACAGRQARPEPIVVPQAVVVPGAAVACVPADMGAAPDYPDTDEALRAAGDAAERYQLTAAGRKLRIARLREVEPVIASCAKAK